MIVERKNPEQWWEFDDLKVGDVFHELNDTVYLMKTRPNGIINAVELESGLLVDYMGCEQVVKVEAKVIIDE